MTGQLPRHLVSTQNLGQSGVRPTPRQGQLSARRGVAGWPGAGVVNLAVRAAPHAATIKQGAERNDIGSIIHLATLSALVLFSRAQ